mmetsp:Transcript_4149/g.11882  ORF Transcript_4149/g.11882 Transcript_4149/m.11882 type:complete len:127 (+) Transcript_4149:444-824(+)
MMTTTSEAATGVVAVAVSVAVAVPSSRRKLSAWEVGLGKAMAVIFFRFGTEIRRNFMKVVCILCELVKMRYHHLIPYTEGSFYHHLPRTVPDGCKPGTSIADNSVHGNHSQISKQEISRLVSRPKN